MSKEYDFSNDLDAILSEFSSFSESISGKPEEPAKPVQPVQQPVIKSEPEKTAAAPRQQTVTVTEVEDTEETRMLFDENEFETAVERRNARAAAPAAKEMAEDKPKLKKRGVPLVKAAEEKKAAKAEEEKKKAEAAAAKKAEKPAKPIKPVNKAPEKKEKKKRSIGSIIGGGVIGTIFMAISALVIIWVGINVHPDSGSAATASAGIKLQLSDKLDVYMNNLASDAMGDLTYIKKKYNIQESATVAPQPNRANFGTVSIGEAAKVMDVIQQARDSGLLDGQDVIFNPDIDFYHDSEIKYYCDETILAICWKEVIDGNTCSCCEVKIADASQLRRKIADDTYGSSNQYYASSLSKQVNAVVAMNADFYQFRNFGIVVYQRELYRYSDYNYTGIYSLYNCVDNCFVTADGNFIFMHKGDKITEEELRQKIKDEDILFSIAFGPILVEDGVVQECTWYPAGEPTTGYSRAGIGIYDNLHYFYMNLNHSAEKAARWTVTQFAQHMFEKGLNNAYGLDGGQTGELVYNHEPYNYIDFGAERLVSDIIYFATAIPEEVGQ